MKQSTSFSILLVLCIQAYSEATPQRDRRAPEPTSICGYNNGGFPIPCSSSNESNHVRRTTPSSILLTGHINDYMRGGSNYGHRDRVIIVNPVRYTTPRSVYPPRTRKCYNVSGYSIPCYGSYQVRE